MDQEQQKVCDEVIKRYANKWVRLIDNPVIRFDDLCNTGYVAALEILPEFDCSRGVPLGGFIRLRVSGAMVDYIRKILGRKRKVKQNTSKQVIALPDVQTIDQVVYRHTMNTLKLVGDKKKSAKLLGISEKTLYNWLNKWEEQGMNKESENNAPRS